MTTLLCDSCGRTAHHGTACPTGVTNNNDYRLDLHLKSGQTVSVWLDDQDRALGLVEQIKNGECVKVMGKGRPMLSDKCVFVPAGVCTSAVVEHDPASEYARQLGVQHGL
jgi:hypothetical protein